MATLTEQLKIDKSVLEENVITATTKNNDVFDMLLPFIEENADLITTNVLGDVGMKALETNESLLKQTQKVVCRKAFSENISSLDLVLTATGFGIVSTQDTAPASKARVDALRSQVSRQWLKGLGILIDMLRRIDGWGSTEQADANIQTVFYSIDMLERYGRVTEVTQESWTQAQGYILAADQQLRKLISDEEMEALLDNIRNNETTDSQEKLLHLMRTVIGLYTQNDTPTGSFPRSILDNKIVEVMEKNPDEFQPYMKSEVYQARHFEDYANTKDSPLFIFNG